MHLKGCLSCWWAAAGVGYSGCAVIAAPRSRRRRDVSGGIVSSKNKLDIGGGGEEGTEGKDVPQSERPRALAFPVLWLLANAKAPLQEIKDRFPWLFSEDEVSTLP